MIFSFQYEIEYMIILSFNFFEQHSGFPEHDCYLWCRFCTTLGPTCVSVRPKSGARGLSWLLGSWWMTVLRLNFRTKRTQSIESIYQSKDCTLQEKIYYFIRFFLLFFKESLIFFQSYSVFTL